mgnify:FL=1
MSTTTFRGIALASAAAVLSGVALVVPAAPAFAAPVAIGPISISGLPADIAVPYDGTTSASATITFNVQFSGAPVGTDAEKNSVSYKPYDSAYNSPTVAALDARETDPLAPRVYEPATSGAVQPDIAVPYTVTVSAYTTPGRYRVNVPVSQYIYDKAGIKTVTTQVATADFNVVATPQTVLAEASYYLSGKFSKKSKWTGYAHLADYMAGSVVKVYYKAKGKKKFTVVASATLNASGDADLKTKKGAIRKTGTAYFAFSAVPYVPAVQSAVGKVKKI